MAASFVTFKRRHGTWGGIWLDAVVDEVHSSEVDVTEHPVEEGSDISDHARPRADVIRIEGVVTNQPIELPQSHADGVQVVDVPFTFDKGAPQVVQAVAGGGLIGQAAGAVTGALGLNQGGGTAGGFNREFDRVGDAYAELRAIKDESRLFTIETTLRTYDEMIMLSFEVNRNSEKGHGLYFTATARQLIVVTTSAANPDPFAIVQKGKGLASQGNTPTKPGDLAGDSASAFYGIGQAANIFP